MARASQNSQAPRMTVQASRDADKSHDRKREFSNSIHHEVFDLASARSLQFFAGFRDGPFKSSQECFQDNRNEGADKMQTVSSITFVSLFTAFPLLPVICCVKILQREPRTSARISRIS